MEAVETAGLEELGDGVGGNVFDIAAPLVDGVNLGGVHVQTEDGGAGACELEGEREADVTQTDDGDFHDLNLSNFKQIAKKRKHRVNEMASQDFYQRPMLL